MAKVHIMMATYNGEKYIAQQMKSILNQTYQDWNLFISDDCSDDRTLEIVEQYIKKYPDKIYLLSKEKKFGSSNANFSFLFKNCPKAEYYMFSDQDDVWVKEKITIMINEFEKNLQLDMPGLVYSDLKVVDQNLNIISESFMQFQKLDNIEKTKEIILYTNFVPGCVMFFNHQLRLTVGEISEDAFFHDWWITMCCLHFGQVYYIEQKLNLYRQHEKNVVGSKGQASFLEDIFKTIKGFFHHPFLILLNNVRDCSNSLDCKIRQAITFKKIYKDSLTEKDVQFINKFCGLRNKRHKVSALFFLFYNFRKTGFSKKIFTAIAILKNLEYNT